MTTLRAVLCVECGDVIGGSDRPRVMLRLRVVGLRAEDCVVPRLPERHDG